MVTQLRTGSFTGHLLSVADRCADRDAVVVLGDEADDAPATLTYGELDRRARALAAVLRERGAPGQRVLVVQSSWHPFATSLLACLYSGAVAVPVPLPGGRPHHDERLAGIVRDTAAGCALTDSDSAADVSQLLARAGYGTVTCLAVDTVDTGRAADWRPPDLDGDSVALLQYTSGSTHDPRGVVVTHANLLANQLSIQRALGTGPGSRLGGWLPFHHDMGLVGQFLHPLWLGATAVMLRPRAFVRQPARWLRMISEYGLTVSGGPDFAYDLCLRRVTDAELDGVDLSGWRVAVNGGEPVRPETVRAFTERFAAHGFRPEAFVPCYGLAEGTLLVAGRSAGRSAAREVDPAALERGEVRPPRPNRPARTLVGCAPDPATDVRIVDPETSVELPAGQVGEIWVRGPGVARGYWKKPAETAATFHAVTAAGEAGFLRTGDLGVLDEDGGLFVTGRSKDVIIVAGRNLYPQDVERRIRRASRMFAANTAFGVPGDQERVVIVQEVHTATCYDPDFQGLTRVVQRCVEEEFDVAAGGVVLVRVGSVRRTTSGKMERSAMRRLFLARKLKPLHQVVTADVERLVARP